MASTLGPNAWLVDEMYEQYLADPTSVSESWQEFFSDYEPSHGSGISVAESGGGNGAAPARLASPEPEPEAEAAREAKAEPTPKAAQAPTPATAPPPATVEVEPAVESPEPTPLRGAAAAIVKNMEASLGVPTATSARQVPAKLLEVNRRVINGYLARTRGGKVSFTHLIGYAVVQALKAIPALNSTYAVDADGKPTVTRHQRVNLGLAVDLEKKDGTRTLMVPVIKGADRMDFGEFWSSYEEVIRKVRTGKLGADDFAGTTVTLTNPGTIGTVHSVPRLMPGQGAIIGVGTIDYSAEFQAADPNTLAELGVSKVITLTSTYDHRIIQGAESGMFLKQVHALLLGEDGFYDEIFGGIGVPYEPVRWRRDVSPMDSQQSRLEKQNSVHSVINIFRVRGHLIADLDPLRWKEPETHHELDPATYGLTIWDLDREFVTGGLAGTSKLALRDILKLLRDAYCRTIGVEYMHIQEADQKRWIQEHVEGVGFELSRDEQRHVLGRLNAAEAFEKFLDTKYLGHKRFGVEGGESAIALIDAILDEAATSGIERAVLGMAHRGRLNVLANIVGKSHGQIFREFEGYVDPSTIQGSGDVKYHLGAKGTFVGRSGHEMPVELAANPSHLEAVDPVVVGMTRAMQDTIDVPEAFSVLPLLIHGDAAFAGQGVVAETLNLSALRGYRVGGTVHLVINNQVGFTTTPDSARSSVYPTDVAKMVQAPIFHVNGDDPEACVRVARMAFQFRQAFKKDVVIDMWCYRRHGHNEGDDPSYTQPLMYKRIEGRRSVRKLYTETLVKRGDLTLEEAEQALDDFRARLQEALDDTRASAPSDEPSDAAPRTSVGLLPRVETGVDRSTLDEIFDTLLTVPPDFAIHPKLAKQFDARRKLYEAGEVDWALAEALAFGSLVLEGTDIRMAGQDSRRGTFSQRHATVTDFETGAEHTMLQHLRPEQGRFLVYDSLLSEYAALGFEYGYSVVNQDTLTIWEAQFGDFVNGAQIIIDQFLCPGEEKWNQTSGLTLLLPHGYEGQGPEHSSARIERFLILCAEDNIQVANCTQAANYFHLLRRQMHREVRKPLVVFTPKSLLRARPARSSIDEMTSGSFLEVIRDSSVPDPGAVRRVVLGSGKVTQDCLARRDEAGSPVAVVRVEQLYPWPFTYVEESVATYPNATEVVWVQEEPENMGPWTFVKGKLYESFEESHAIRRVSRAESSSPATGSATKHNMEQSDVVERAVVEGI